MIMKNTLAQLLSFKTLYRLFAFEYLFPVAILSFVAWYISYTYGVTTTYNDAMSHLNISRSIVDNLEPGFSQLGGVWLPLTHILPLPLIWNDWAWHSGFAGSLFSMIAYIISVGAIYKTIMLLTMKRFAAIVGGLAFAFNLNMLYLQTTPMTEPVYIAFFALSVLMFTYYLTAKEENTKYLLVLGLIGFLQVLTRYDGWFVIGIQALIIAAHEMVVVRSTFTHMLGKLFIFGTPVAFGIGLWLIWNLLIFNNPLYFAFGPYSAHSQQEVFANTGELITKGNILASIQTYGNAMLHNVGAYMLALAVAAIGVFVLSKQIALSVFSKLLFVAFLAAPILFNVLALLLGFSIIFTPPFVLEQSLINQGPWFNIRYGLLALPFVAVLVGLFAAWRKLALTIAILTIALQAQYMYNYGIAALIDGTVGKSAFYASDMSNALKDRVQPGDKVIMSLYSFNQVAFMSGIRLDQVVHEGVSRQWKQALLHPEQYGQWVVMANASNDPIYETQIMKREKEFLNHYELVFTGNNASLYKLKKK